MVRAVHYIEALSFLKNLQGGLYEKSIIIRDSPARDIGII